MTKKNITLLILFLIWLIASGFIAWQAQFIDPYLQHQGITQNKYTYSLNEVMCYITAYAVLMLNYALLFLSKFSNKHPHISYLLFSILPLLMIVSASLFTLHASSPLGTFFTIMIFTFLLHFLLVPVLLAIYRKYANPITDIQ